MESLLADHLGLQDVDWATLLLPSVHSLSLRLVKVDYNNTFACLFVLCSSGENKCIVGHVTIVPCLNPGIRFSFYLSLDPKPNTYQNPNCDVSLSSQLPDPS